MLTPKAVEKVRAKAAAKAKEKAEGSFLSGCPQGLSPLRGLALLRARPPGTPPPLSFCSCQPLLYPLLFPFPSLKSAPMVDGIACERGLTAWLSFAQHSSPSGTDPVRC